MKFIMAVFICALTSTVAACTPVLWFTLRNASEKQLTIYASGERRLSIGPQTTSRKSVFFGGMWSLKAENCEYRYYFPEVYGLVKTHDGRTRVLTLVLDREFVVHLEYPPGWKGEKPEIVGLPAVPEIACAGD